MIADEQVRTMFSNLPMGPLYHLQLQQLHRRPARNKKQKNQHMGKLENRLNQGWVQVFCWVD